MKRRDLLKHLDQQGCMVHREGSRHTVVINPGKGSISTIPRHTEIDSFLAKKICRDLGISEPLKR